MKWHPTADVFCVWEATDNVFCVSSSVRWETTAVCFVAKIDFSSRCSVATGRLSLRRYDDNLIGMGTDSGFFRTFADFCCWPDGSARYKVKFHYQRCDHCNKVNRGADDQVMKVGAHMETILGRGYLDALDSWWKKTLEDWSHFWQMDIIPPERV